MLKRSGHWPGGRLLVLATAACLLHCVCGQEILRVYTDIDGGSRLEGSTEGGTRLWIYGAGFSKDPTAGGNQVYVGGAPCTVDNYQSRPESLVVADTPPGIDSDDFRNLPIEVIVDGKRRATKYGFNYRWYRTPELYRVQPYSAYPDQFVTFKGYFREGRLYSGDITALREVSIGAAGKFSLPDTEDVEQSDLRRKVGCNAPGDALPGYYNASLTVGRYYGRATTSTTFTYFDYGRLDHRPYMVNAEGKPYTFQLVPKIESISHSTGSLAGGLDITITGKGFGSNINATEVDIDGVACTVASVGPRAITCTTAEVTSIEEKSVYTGGRGVRRQVYNRKISHSNSEFPDFSLREPTTNDVIDTLETEYNRGTNYEQRLRTILKPRVTGNHTFFMVVDDIGDVYLTPLGNGGANTTKILALRRYSRYFLTGLDSVSTEPVHLEADNHYLVEVHMAEYGGQDYLLLGMRHASPDGEYKFNSMREIQAVRIAANTTLETQRITLGNVVDGTFRLSYSTRESNGIKISDITGSMDFDASTSKIRSELLDLVTMQEYVSVTEITTEEPNTRILDIIFSANIDTQRELFTADTIRLECEGPCSVSIERVQEGSPDLGGSFRLGIGENFTEPLPHNAGASDVEQALNEAGLIDWTATSDGRLTITKIKSSNANYTLFVTFSGVFGSIDSLITVDGSGLYGGINNSTVETEVWRVMEGSSDQLHMPIPSDMLFTPEDTPQVHVRVNGILAACATEQNATCTFQASVNNTPIVSSVSVTEGASSRDLQISGEALGGTNMVLVGGQRCVLGPITDTEVDCVLPSGGPAGDHKIMVYVENQGLAQHQGGTHTISNNLVVSAVNPSIGSLGGGTKLNITGSGFGEDLEKVSVAIGNRSAEVTRADNSIVEILTPSGAAAGAVNGSVVINGVEQGFNFEYESSAVASSLSPSSGSSITKTEITITGTGFSATRELLEVRIGGTACPIKLSSETSIVCETDGGPPGSHAVEVYVEGKGLATGSLTFKYEFEITSIAPTEGSIKGGTVVTVQGAGFGLGGGSDQNVVSVGIFNSPCEILEQNYTTVVCVTGPLVEGTPDTSQVVALALKNYYAQCLVGNGTGNATTNENVGDLLAGSDGCLFTYSNATTPMLDDQEISGLDGDSLAVTGSGLGNNTNATQVHLAPDTVICPGAICRPVLYSELDGLGMKCTVTAVEDGRVEFTVPHGIARRYRVVVYVEGVGFAAGMPTLLYNASITSVSPNELSVSGGHLSIVGSGFSASLSPVGEVDPISVKVGRYACEVESVKWDEIVCTAIGASNGTTRAVTVEITPDGNEDASPVYNATCNAMGEKACNITHLSEKSPSVSSKTVDVEGSEWSLVLRGQGFNESVDNNIVSIDGYKGYVARVTSSNSTHLEVSMSGLVGGVHEIVVEVVGKGFAWSSRSVRQIEQNLTVTGVAPASGSIAGGTRIVLTGEGFNALNPAQNNVSICSSPCQVQTANSTSIECITTPLVNPSLAPLYGLDEPSLLTGGTIISTYSSWAKYAFDGDFSTRFYSYAYPCYVGKDFGEGTLVKVTAIRIHPEGPKSGGSSATTRMLGGVFEGSLDGVTYETIFVIRVEPPQGYTTYDINASVPLYRFVRYVGPANSRCRIGEIEFHGVRYSDIGENLPCNVSLAVGSSSSQSSLIESSLPGSFQYDASLTPNVTTVNPSMGTTAGGTSVAIEGSGFGTQVSGVSVEIDGVACVVTEVTDSRVVCTTGARSEFVQPSLQIMVEGKGAAATNGLKFTYMDRWSATTTWGGAAPPREGETVVIPPGQNILLDISPPLLYVIILEGTLQFSDDQDIHLQCSYIFVRGGHLIIGTEDEPFQHKATITLHGHPDTHKELPLYGAKNIAVRYGTLDIHGRPKLPTWTQINSTAGAGDTRLNLKESVNWEVGDKIVLAPTSYDFEEAEERTIVSIEDEGKTLVVDPPLNYAHYGEVETYGNHSIDMRAEIGVLTRNIVVKGDDQSLELQWGAHIMLHSPGEGTSVGRLEYMECYLCGQAFNLGRYPIHFHMLGNIHDSYVRGCSIHHTFNRAVTIHGVKYFTVENNVAYDNMGHAFFIEDSIEENNRILNNLGLVTRPSSSLLDTDQTPATFWITHPTNYFIGNHAAGSARYGFWFDLQKHPTGPSFTLAVCPPGNPLGTFRGNTAHSNGRYGLRIFNSFLPREEPCMSTDIMTNTPVPAIMEDFTGFKNKRNGVVTSLIGDVRFKDFKLADNLRTGIEVVKAITPVAGAMTDGSIIVARSGNMPAAIPHSLRDDPDKGRTFAFIASGQTYNYTVQNTVFVNYDGSDTTVLGSCSHCNFPNNKNQDAKVTTFKNTTFINSPNKVMWGYPYKHTFLDEDGTLLGAAAGASVTRSWPHLEGPCSPTEDWTNSLVCPVGQNVARFAVHSQQPFSYFQNDRMLIKRVEVGGMQESGWSSVPYQGMKWSDPTHGWAIGVATGHTYEVHWKEVEFTYIEIEGSALAPDDHFFVKFNYTEYRDHFKVFNGGEEILGSVVGLPPTAGRTGKSFHNVTERTLTVLFSGSGSTGFGTTQKVKIEASACPREGCPEPEIVNVEREDFIRNWSNATQWPNGSLPQKGDDVEIEEAWRMLMDVEPPELNNLVIRGELMFDDQRPQTTLQAHSIQILGGELRAGTAARPFPQKATIQLNGDRSSFPPSLPGSLDAGPKVMAVFGGLKLFGQRRPVRWTRLAATSRIGDTRIVLDESVDWQVGEEIMLASSSHFQFDSEIAVIKERVDDTTLELEDPLEYKHWGAPTFSTLKGKTVELRTEVALLSRNIKIVGNDTGDRYGAHVLVAQVVDEEAGRIYSGTVELDGVEFSNGGQFQTIRYSLNMNEANGTESFIRRCSFHNNQNTAIFVRNTHGLLIEDNVIYDTVGTSLDVVESNNVTIERNLAAVARKRDSTPDHEVYEALANYMICIYDVPRNSETPPCRGVSLKNNVAAGSLHISFGVRGDDCDTQPSESLYMGNIAHSSRVGVLLVGREKGVCSQISGFTVHHTVEAGITTNWELSRVEVEDVILSDNLVGLALVPANGETSGTAEVKDAVVIGNSDNGGCGYDEDVECMDRSEERETGVGSRTGGSGTPGGAALYSGCGHRVGLLATVFDSDSQGFPRKVPCIRFGELRMDSGFGGFVSYSDILVHNWTSLDRCNYHNNAIASNPSSSDSAPIHHLENIQKDNVEEDALIFIDSPDPKWVNHEDCVDMDCTGLLNFIFKDTDGSVTGSVSQIVSSNTMAIANDNRCTFRNAWNAYRCTDAQYNVLHFESQDVDRFSRRVNPVNVTGAPNNASSVNVLNCYMDRRWDDDYTSLLRLSRFPVLVDLDNEYNITFTGTNPRSMRLGFSGVENNQGVLVNMIYQSPEMHDIFVDGVKKDADPSPIDLNAPVGGHFWDNPLRRLSIVIKGDSNVTIRTINAVQVSLTLRTTVDEFYDKGGTDAFVRNIAYTLGIPMSRVRVVDVVSAAGQTRRRLLEESSETRVEFFITAEESTEPPAEEDAEPGTPPSDESNDVVALQELESLAVQIEQRVESNTLFTAPPGEDSFDVQVGEVATRLSRPPPAPCVPSCRNTTDSNSYCQNGVCQCEKEGTTYFAAFSFEDIIEGGALENLGRPSGCYYAADDSPTPLGTPSNGSPNNEESPTKKDKGQPVVAIAVGVVAAVVIIVVVVVVVCTAKERRARLYSVCGGAPSATSSHAAPHIVKKVQPQPLPQPQATPAEPSPEETGLIGSSVNVNEETPDAIPKATRSGRSGDLPPITSLRDKPTFHTPPKRWR